MSLKKRTSLAIVFFALLTTQAHAETTWIQDDVAKCLSDAERSGKRALVFVTASWCPSCQELKREVFNDLTHRPILDKFERVRVDFDKKDNHRWVKELVILGLPTVVVLQPDGTPVGRIRGYEGAGPWTRELDQLSAAADRRADLERDAKLPGASLPTQLKFARMLLERGEEAEALAHLDRLSGSSDATTAPEALFVLGRYFHRGRLDPAKARPLWRALAIGFPESPYAPGAWWWYARAESESGQPGSGARVLLDAATDKPEDSGRVRRAAAFLKKHPRLLESVTPELREVIDTSLASAQSADEREALLALKATLIAPSAN